jgi:hypothetical protein
LKNYCATLLTRQAEPLFFFTYEKSYNRWKRS